MKKILVTIVLAILATGAMTCEAQACKTTEECADRIYQLQEEMFLRKDKEAMDKEMARLSKERHMDWLLGLWGAGQGRPSHCLRPRCEPLSGAPFRSRGPRVW